MSGLGRSSPAYSLYNEHVTSATDHRPLLTRATYKQEEEAAGTMLQKY